MAGIVGREEELAAGDEFLRAVATGRAALVLEGEAGIGKTTVWTAIAERAREAGMLVLVTRPAEAEASLTLSALADLLQGVPEADVAALPEPQRLGLDAALLRTSPAAGTLDARVLGTAVRGVLVRLAERTPIVLAIDDVQWTDGASVAALAYGLRRAGGARVGLLLARRTGLPMPLDGDALAPPDARRVVRVGPVTLGALHHVLRKQLPEVPPRSLLVRIHDAAHGNPLFALEIARSLHETGWPDTGQPLPVPADVRELVERRLARLPASTRSVLLLAATTAVPRLSLLEAAAGRSVDDDVRVAVDAAVASVDDGVLAFTHPLFAGGTYALASDGLRRDAHRRLSDAADDPEERARHRALVTEGPDPQLAADLEAAAAAASARGAPTAAIGLLELALARTPDADGVARLTRSTRLAELLFRTGDPARAIDVLEPAVATAEPGRERAMAKFVLVSVMFDADTGSRAADVARSILDDVAGDPETGALALALIAAVGYEDLASAAWHGRESRRLLDLVADPDPRIATVVLHRSIGAALDDGKPFPWADVERALEYERIAPLPAIGDRVSATIGPLLVQDDQIDEGRRWLEATLAAVLEEGDEGSLPYALSHFPRCEIQAGNWARAEQMAHEQLAAAQAMHLAEQMMSARYNLGLVWLHRGRFAEAHEVLAQVLEESERAGDRWMASNAHGTLGSLALAEGDLRAAADRLVRAEDVRALIADPRPRRYDADLIESLVGVGALDEAARRLVPIEERAAAFNRPSGLGLAARGRALLLGAHGDTDAAIDAAREAVAAHERATSPFDVARARLVLGALLRRRRERTAAKAAFDAALATFERVGSPAWAARAQTELDRVGIRRTTTDELTDGERRVAELVATGMTNREVAAALFVSPKTVEANLARAYAKLGVRSRAELGARMGGTAEPQT